VLTAKIGILGLGGSAGGPGGGLGGGDGGEEGGHDGGREGGGGYGFSGGSVAKTLSCCVRDSEKSVLAKGGVA